jgi:hypothetical protein
MNSWLLLLNVLMLLRSSVLGTSPFPDGENLIIKNGIVFNYVATAQALRRTIFAKREVTFQGLADGLATLHDKAGLMSTKCKLATENRMRRITNKFRVDNSAADRFISLASEMTYPEAKAQCKTLGRVLPYLPSLEIKAELITFMHQQQLETVFAGTYHYLPDMTIRWEYNGELFDSENTAKIVGGFKIKNQHKDETQAARLHDDLCTNILINKLGELDTGPAYNSPHFKCGDTTSGEVRGTKYNVNKQLVRYKVICQSPNHMQQATSAPLCDELIAEKDMSKTHCIQRGEFEKRFIKKDPLHEANKACSRVADLSKQRVRTSISMLENILQHAGFTTEIKGAELNAVLIESDDSRGRNIGNFGQHSIGKRSANETHETNKRALPAILSAVASFGVSAIGTVAGGMYRDQIMTQHGTNSDNYELKKSISALKLEQSNAAHYMEQLDSRLNRLEALQSKTDETEKEAFAIRILGEAMEFSQIFDATLRELEILFDVVKGVINAVSTGKADTESLPQKIFNQIFEAAYNAIGVIPIYDFAKISAAAQPFGNNSILMVYAIPSVEPEEYALVEMIGLPQFKNNRTILPKIPHPYLALAKDTRHFVPLAKHEFRACIEGPCRISSISFSTNAATCGMEQLFMPSPKPCIGIISEKWPRDFYRDFGKQGLLYVLVENATATFQCPFKSTTNSKSLELSGQGVLTIPPLCSSFIVGTPPHDQVHIYGPDKTVYDPNESNTLREATNTPVIQAIHNWVVTEFKGAATIATEFHDTLIKNANEKIANVKMAAANLQNTLNIIWKVAAGIIAMIFLAILCKIARKLAKPCRACRNCMCRMCMDCPKTCFRTKGKTPPIARRFYRTRPNQAAAEDEMLHTDPADEIVCANARQASRQSSTWSSLPRNGPIGLGGV